jgi:hypothetical protein
MKTEFHIRPVFIRAKSDKVEVRIGSERMFHPLAARDLYANRIDLARRGSMLPRRYPYKRDDESVN